MEPIQFFTENDAAALPVGFLVTLCASSGGGKSVWLQHMLSLPSMRNRFGCAICVSPTSCLDCMHDDDEPNQFACIPRKYHYDLTENNLEDIIENIKTTQSRLRREGRAQEVLLVLDDIFCSTQGPGRMASFVDFISTKRHYLCSICAIMQCAKALPPSGRTQVNGAFFARPLTHGDRQVMSEWYLCRTSMGSHRETLGYAAGIMKEVYSHSHYAFLYVNPSSKETDTRKTVRVALAPSGTVKPFKLKFKKMKKGKSVRQNKTVEDNINVEPEYNF